MRMRKKSLLLLSALLAFAPAFGQTGEGKCAPCGAGGGAAECVPCHPWQGRCIGFLGDSMTDPNNNSRDIPKKYWN